MSAAGRALSKALDRPEDWATYGLVLHSKFRVAYIIHKPTAMHFWTCNGSWFFDGYRPDEIEHSIGLVERHWLYFKARKIIAMGRRANPTPPGDIVLANFNAVRAK